MKIISANNNNTYFYKHYLQTKYDTNSFSNNAHFFKNKKKIVLSKNCVTFSSRHIFINPTMSHINYY